MRAFFLLGLLVMVTSCKKEKYSERCIDITQKNPEAACIEIYDPVCGCDLITYSNSCFAKINGLTSWTEGACS